MSAYKEYPYNAAVPGENATNGPLAEQFANLATSIQDVHTICDLGCGNGYMASILAEKGYVVTGVDGSESGINLARNHYGGNVEFYCSLINIHLRNLFPNKFDLVVSSDVIEHLYCPTDLLEAANALLRPQGHLLVGTPYHGYFKNLALSVFNKWDDHHTTLWDGGHIKFFSVATLSKILGKRNFKVIKFFYFGRIPYLWKNMICHAIKMR